MWLMLGAAIVGLVYLAFMLKMATYTNAIARRIRKGTLWFLNMYIIMVVFRVITLHFLPQSWEQALAILAVLFVAAILCAVLLQAGRHDEKLKLGKSLGVSLVLHWIAFPIFAVINFLAVLTRGTWRALPSLAPGLRWGITAVLLLVPVLFVGINKWESLFYKVGMIIALIGLAVFGVIELGIIVL